MFATSKTAVLVTGIFEILFGLALLIKKTISMLEKYNQSILASCIPS